MVAKLLFPKLAGLTPSKAAKLKNGGLLAAHILNTKYGVTATDVGSLRRLLIRDGLATRPARRPEPVEPFDLPVFANTVLRLARDSRPEDRFHDNKVFIAPLWRACQGEPAFPRLTLPEFKRRLVEANARHLLHLSRADFVQAMDPALVAESETVYLNATFHFVRLGGDRP